LNSGSFISSIAAACSPNADGFGSFLNVALREQRGYSFFILASEFGNRGLPSASIYSHLALTCEIIATPDFLPIWLALDPHRSDPCRDRGDRRGRKKRS
jgi:hypothetical protein